MHGAEPLGHQDLDLPPQQLLAGVAEERLGLGVDQDDPAGRSTITMASGADSSSPRNFASVRFRSAISFRRLSRTPQGQRLGDGG